MKFTFILAVTSLAALASATPALVVADAASKAASAFNNVAGTANEFILKGNAALDVGFKIRLIIPGTAKAVNDIEQAISDARDGFSEVALRAARAAEAAAVLANHHANVQAATDAAANAAEAYDAAAKASDELSNIVATSVHTCISLGQNMKKVNLKDISSAIFAAGNAAEDVRKAANIAADVARYAVAACSDFGRAAAHADVDAAS